MSGITDPKYLARRRTSILSAEGDEHTRLRPARRQGVLAAGGRPAAAVHARGRSTGSSTRSRRAAGPTSPSTSASRTRSRSSASCSARRRRTGSCSAAGPPTCCGSSTATCTRTCRSIIAAQDELDEYTRELIARRAHEPADDLLTDLIAAEEEGDRLSTDELVMMVEAVIVGGTDTTRNQLGCTVALFAEHPEQWKLLAEQPELAPRAVEESMRYFGRSAARGASPARTSSTGTSCSRRARSSPVDGHGQLRPERCSPTRACSTSPASRPASRS